MSIKYRVEDKCIAWGNSVVGGVVGMKRAAEILTSQSEQIEELHCELDKIDLANKPHKEEHLEKRKDWVDQPDSAGYWWLFGPYLGRKNSPREDWYLHGVKNVFSRQGMGGAKWHAFHSSESHATRTDDIIGLWAQAMPPMLPGKEKK